MSSEFSRRQIRHLHRLVNIVIVFSLLTSLYPAQLWASPISTATPLTNVVSAISNHQTEPDALANPVSISRSQSAYSSGSTIVVNYTINNNLLPTLAPNLAASANTTDTVGILASFDPTEDANTQRNLELEMTLTNAILVDANGATVNGNTLTWALDDLLPLNETTISVTIDAPATAAGFVELDDGAELTGEMHGSAIGATVRPAVVIPDALSVETVAGTVDADVTDKHMLWVSAEFQQDPLAIFEYIQSFGYDPYRGSLRGTRGTLWNEAGNSLDQSSLLIAMLRAAGVPARYRHGTLSQVDAQTLINSMFDDHSGVAGSIDPSATLSDPENDAALIATVQDHWWVEAYLPTTGAWTDLDPSFTNAAVGDSFAPAGAFDRTNSVPTSEQHTIDLALRVEQYTAFPVDGDFLNTIRPLTATVPTAQAAAKRLILSQFVDEETTAGLAFANRQITYEPYFGFIENDSAFLGDPFGDLLTNFPLSTNATTGAWIEYNLTSPDGQTDSYERVVKDLLGPDVRINGGQPDIAFDLGSQPFFLPGEQYIHWVLPNRVPDWAFQRLAAQALPEMLALGDQSQDILDDAAALTDGIDALEYDTLMEAAGKSLSGLSISLALTGLEFALSADNAIDDIADGTQTHIYYSSPRMFAIASQLVFTAREATTVDLRTTRAEVIVAPGQNIEAEKTAQWLKGIVESDLEGDVLEGLVGVPVITTSRLFAAMDSLGIEPVTFTPDDIGQLNLYPYSANARALMLQALLEGKTVIAPSEPVLYEGEDSMAWWEVDADTGIAISVGENGLNVAAVNWAIVENLVEQIITSILEYILNQILGAISGGWLGTPMGGNATIQFIQHLMAIGESLDSVFRQLAEALSGGPRSTVNLESWTYLPAHNCPIDNCGIEQFMVDGVLGQPIPLPEMAFAYDVAEPTNERAGAMVAVSDNGSGGVATATLTTTPTSSNISAADSAIFSANISANFAGTFDVVAHAPPGWSVSLDGAGNVTATPHEGVTADTYTILLVAQSRSDRSVVTSTTHDITVNTSEAVDFGVAVEPNITIPQNAPAVDDVSNQTNDGEAEIPDSAYRIDIANESPNTKTYNLNVMGAPASWVVLDGAAQTASSVTLQAGEKTAVGLYVVPDALPAHGTSHLIEVSISDGAALNDSQQILWTMPGQAHNFVTIEPQTLYLASTDSVDFTLTMENVGNAAGTFPIAATIPVTHSFTNLPADMTLADGAMDSAEITLNVTNARIGQRYPLQISSMAPDSYTQYAFADVIIVSPDTELLFGAADEIAACSADNTLAAQFSAVANAVSVLEGACNGGSCNSLQRDAVVNAADSLTAYLGNNYAGVDTTAATDAVAILGAADEVADILAAIPAVATAVGDLAAPVCAIAEAQPALDWEPSFDAALVNDTVAYSLTLENIGTETTTYDVTVDLPGGPFADSPTLAAGATKVYDFDVSSGTADLYTLHAEAVAQGVPLAMAEADAFLNVVDQFVQTTAVNPTPAFVETGISESLIRITVANFANLSLEAVAHVELVDEMGVVLDSADTNITIRPGNPMAYDLNTFDTSDLPEGAYTIRVELRHPTTGDPIVDGANSGNLTVGQALGAAHYVAPDLVAPGTATVTTVISTAILVDTILPSPNRQVAPLWEPTGRVELSDDESAEADEQLVLTVEEGVEEESAEIANSDQGGLSLRSTTGIIRIEENDSAILYNGQTLTDTADFNHQGYGSASGNMAAYANDDGDNIVYTFNGDWFSFGVMGDPNGGEINIDIDGTDFGTIDMYRRYSQPINTIIDGLGAGSHTVTLTLLDTFNPNGGNVRVYFDYFETWDGTVEADASFNLDLVPNDRVYYSGGWSYRNDTDASNGDYIRAAVGNVWFHFTGDSVTFEAFQNASSGLADIRIDGQLAATVDLYSSVDMTQTYSFDGLGAGPHIINVGNRRATTYADQFHAPAISPAYVAPECNTYCRYEESDDAILYNGVPYTDSPSSFSRQTLVQASDSFAMQSSTVSDTFGLTFTGEQATIGFYTTNNTGQANIYIDGSYVETVDTFTRDVSTLSRRYPNLGAGAHTILIEVTGNQHPNSTGTRILFDYIDVWDGSALTPGSQQAEDAAFMAGNVELNDASEAAGGTYLRAEQSNRAIWVPFEGDNIQFDAFTNDDFDRTAEIWVDGVLVDEINFWTANVMTPTFAYDGFGAGVHLMKLVAPFANIGLDSVTFPATQAAEGITLPTGLVRYEENDLTYDGFSWQQRPSAVTIQSTNGFAASTQRAVGRTGAGPLASLTFDGVAAQIGFLGDASTGSAEIYVNNNLHRSIDLSANTKPFEVVRITGLTDGTHTIDIEVVNDRVALDYIDVWDGSEITETLVDPWPGDVGDETTVHFGEFSGFNGNFADTAIGERYVTGWFNANHRVWHNFVGDSITFWGFTRNQPVTADVYIDGVFIEQIEMQYDFTDRSIAFTYTGLDEGMHEIRIDNVNAMRIDAFELTDSPVPPAPFIEWYDDTSGGGFGSFGTPAGHLAGVAAGDIDNDGVVEIIAPKDTWAADGSSNFVNSIMIYSGDGSDAGNGTPLEGRIEFPFSGGISRDTIGSVAIADLDGLPGAEIVVGTEGGMYAYKYDGSNHTELWFNDTHTAFGVSATPAIGNLDFDPEPEIVINMSDTLVVYETNGDIAWTRTYTENVGMPVLADITGDGVLDIIVVDRNGIVTAFDYDFGAPDLLWTVPLSTEIGITRGGPAIADIDNDGEPEIAVSHNSWLTVLNADGSLLWETQLDEGAPGGVSIADVDGDLEVEIVTGMRHDDGIGIGRIYALNADGSILWERPAYDSTSANSAAVLDVNGDGIYEIAWNGAEYGFTIFNGADGEILYQEPGLASLTGTDMPIFADVDNDGYAEIVGVDNTGLGVIGMDGVWGEARPLWNQHTYHITNINDDMTIPFSELDSWDIHNTYRTQFPADVALPVFGINISHTVSVLEVAVNGFNVTPDVSDAPSYQWNYVQTIASPTVTRTVELVLTNLQPGEVREVAQGTTISYTLNSGQNLIELPPLYVAVAHIISIDPTAQTIGAGATASYDVTLTNPSDTAAVYTLQQLGLPAGWVDGLPPTVNVPANSDVVLTVNVTAPADGEGDYAFVISVTTNQGGNDSAAAALSVIDALDLTLTPSTQTANPGETATYDLTVTNLLPTAQDITLLGSGLPELTLPASILVAGNSSEVVNVEAESFNAGPLPFTVMGTNESGANDSDGAVLVINSSQAVSIDLDPNPADGGPGLPTVVTVIVSNDGDALTTYDLSVTTPAGWQAELAEDKVTIAPFVFNSAEIQLILTPPQGTTAGAYEYNVTATANNRTEPATATATGTVNVGSRGVQIELDPTSRTLSPSDTATWDVTVTNTGSVADTFDLSATGIVAFSASFTPASVTLNPGQATTVQLMATDFSFANAQLYSFAVVATSQADGAIQNQAKGDITFSGLENVEVSYFPPEQTVNTNETAYYLLTITNTGNIATPYDLLFNSLGLPNLTVLGDMDNVFIPAKTVVRVLVSASSSQMGMYEFDGSAESIDANASDTAILIVNEPTAIVGLTVNSHTLAWRTAILMGAVGLMVLTSLARRKRQ